MELSGPPLVVAFELSEKRKAIVADALAGASAVVYLTELDEAARTEALRNTGALLIFNTSKELRSGEAELLDGARPIQFMIAGVDFIPLGELPEGVPVATNGGGYAESMAEHALEMAPAQAPDLGARKPQTWPVQSVHAEPHARWQGLRYLRLWWQPRPLG
jgi:phosphoglycerate dehydrogenase-like enzyme